MAGGSLRIFRGAGRVVDAWRKVSKIRIGGICGFTGFFSFALMKKNCLGFKNPELARIKSY